MLLHFLPSSTSSNIIFLRCNTERKNRYRSVLLAERPDVIITVFPMDLLLTLEVAKDIGNLPVLHLATDLDTKMYEVSIDGKQICNRIRSNF